MDHLRTWMLLLVVSILVAVFSASGVRTQDSDDELAEGRENAKQLLTSADAAFLSGAGLTMALHLSGASALNSVLHPLKRGNAGVVVPFNSNQFQLMVNDPAQDVFELSDTSTQSETSVAGFGNNVVVTFNDSGEFRTFPTFMGYSLSTDGGASFTDLGKVPPFVLPPVLQLNGGDPALVADGAGDFYVAHLTSVTTAVRPAGFTNAIGINKSTDGGQTWGPTVYPAVGGVRVNSTQDKEFIAVDVSGGACHGYVYVSWTSFGGTIPPGGSPNPPIFVSRSTDGGATFSVPMQISPFAHATQGSEPAVGPAGELYVAWFRITGPPPGPGLPPLGPAIMVAKSTNCGATFGPAVEVASLTPIGFGGAPVNARLRGNFRTNSFPRIDVNPVNGDVYIVYNANPPGPDGADIFLTRSTNGGSTWSAPTRVNSDPGDNDQFFPDVAVNANGAIEVAWYDQRRDPENFRMDVYHARSTDRGLSFGPNQRVTSTSSLPAVGYDAVVNPNYMGDYIDLKAITTATGPGFDFLLSWGDWRRVIETEGGIRPDQDVFFRLIH
jgi:hypothetical protein